MDVSALGARQVGCRCCLGCPLQRRGLPVCRYRAAITEELSRACNVETPAVWRQAKDMLKEEGVEVATDADNGAQAAPSDATEAAVQVCAV